MLFVLLMKGQSQRIEPERSLRVEQMSDDRTHNIRKNWTTPRLERLQADLGSIAGNRHPPGDNGLTNGKSLTPPTS